GEIALHQLHAKCHSRIRYQKTCPIHGEIANDEIIKGYEVSKGEYIEIDPDELEKLRSGADRSLTIDTFVAPDEIDSIYFDGRMYFLSPDGDVAREPYGVLLEALRHLGRWGVGQIIFSGKEQIVVIRPYGDALNMVMLNYQAEIRDPEETILAPATVRRADRMVKLAEQLIESWTDESFDFSKYEDTHLRDLKALIEAKVEGREIVAPEVEEGPEIINLMDALQKSLGKKSGGKRQVTPAAKATSRPRRVAAKKSKQAS
ncbi:MAG: hypothetical protein IAG10_11105, partial [Planctomycetaceae bacterium]|nr:hypothetical protein [Planctomycetaceae bacterium]